MPTRLTVSDIQGIVAILPTPATPDAAEWKATQTVDLAETERLTEAIVASGVDVLLTNGTFGEGAALLQEEIEAFNDVVVQTVRGRVPVFAGATTLSTRDTIRRGRRLLEIGADGLFLGRPMWLALDDAGIVRLYRDIAEALDTAMVIYDNPGAFKGKISPEAYGALADIPQIVASKHLGLLARDAFFADLKAVQGRMRLLPLDTDWYELHRLHPDEVTACWSGTVACGPAPVVALKGFLSDGRWEDAAMVTQELNWALEPLFPGGDFEAFMKYSIQIDNARFEGAGYMRPGPTRPPYVEAPQAFLEGGREAGRRWATLQARYGISGGRRT
ncbi:MAG: 4-(2-carboxyphenyl)-2-oxobut-3-enoate aldolase [Actinomycetota bacterium]|nr:4-(2-carboxyphenyl)-2-oxobut-3-enoate aldolase [Actinomycetota bacterium]